MSEHEHKKKSNEIKISKITLWKGISAIILVLLVISIYTNGFDFSKTEKVDKKTTTKSQGSTDNEGAFIKGDPDAKVTIIEYSSFSCGYCNRVRGTIDQILEAYPQDVKLIYKHFTRGGSDPITAQATECAGDQGKFWEMHDMIFDSGSSGDVKSYAANLGLDTTEFNECLDSGKYADKVAADTAEGRALGISGTPSFSINGQLVVGAQPFANFKQVIDAELAK